MPTLPPEDPPTLVMPTLPVETTDRVSTLPEPPIAKLRAASEREQVSRALLDYWQRLMRRCIFFAVKRSLLVGTDARGDGLNALKASQVAITIDGPSVFRDVISFHLPYRGPLPRGALNQAFATTLGGVGPEVLIMPISLRTGQEERTVAVLFGDTPLGSLPEAALHTTVREAGAAFERMIRHRKKL
jgi:hypothetical protein